MRQEQICVHWYDNQPIGYMKMIEHQTKHGQDGRGVKYQEV